MMRIDETSLALHLEVSLAGAPQALVDNLATADRRRRSRAAADMARHLAFRLRGFDIRYEDGAVLDDQPMLFAEILEPPTDAT